MRALLRELFSENLRIDPERLPKADLAHPVLPLVAFGAQAHRPSIRWFQGDPAERADADVRRLYRVAIRPHVAAEAAREASNPFEMSRAGARLLHALAVLMSALGEHQLALLASRHAFMRAFWQARQVRQPFSSRMVFWGV
jgi:hypothetical protein